MIYREIGQSEMWFMMRATTVDPFIQEYRAEDCADLISKALPYNVAVSTSAEWGQIKDVDPTLSFFNWLQPFDPCFLETVQMKLIYINILSKYFLFGDIHINGAMWTSYANKHPGDYKLVTTVMVYAVLPFSLWVSGVIELLGNVPSYVVELLTGH